jgi:opacity protein-like surface antigen
MRTMRRISLALLIALALSTPVFAQAQDGPLSLNATIGPSFGNVGTTFSTVGGVEFRMSDHFSLVGEGGILPRAPFRDAADIAAPATFGDADRTRVNAYHWNGNVTVPFQVRSLSPYVTAGMGTFVADTVTPSRQVNGVWIEARRRVTDFATNIGAGAMYRVNDWLGVGADYRTFFVHRDRETPRVHRFTTGLTLSLK